MTLRNFTSILLASMFLTGNADVVAQPAPDWRTEYLAVDSPLVLLTGVRVIDGTGKAPVEGMSILIENGVIAEVGADLRAPGGARSERRIAEAIAGLAVEIGAGQVGRLQSRRRGDEQARQRHLS